MSRFQVITGELVAASAAVDATIGSLEGAQADLVHSGGALAGTPAAGTYDALVDSLHGVIAGLSTSSGELSAALMTVSHAYEQADESAAGDVGGK